MNLVDLETVLAGLLADSGGDSWTAAERRAYLFEAENAIVVLRPDATSTLATVELVAGVEQAIPADGLRLLRVLHNVAAGGADGRSIRLGDAETAEAFSPEWRATTAAGTVREYLFDEQTPEAYSVIPPAIAGTKVRISYAKRPAAYPSPPTDAALTVADDFRAPLLEWALYRAHSKGGENADMGRAGAHLANFYQLLGIKGQSDQASDPRARK